MTKRMKGTTSPMNTGAFKRVFSVLVVLLLAATLMVGAVGADDTTAPTPITTVEGLQTAFTSGTGAYIISDTFPTEAITTELTFSTTGEVTLDLNGTTLTTSLADSKSLITQTDGKLTLINSKETVAGITSTDDAAYIISVKKGQLTVSSGVKLLAEKKTVLMLYGATDEANTDNTIVTIENGAIIDGGVKGIAIVDLDSSYKVYGVKLSVDGTVQTTSNSDFLASNGCVGIYVDGNVNNKEGITLNENVPKITITENAKVSGKKGSGNDKNAAAGPAVYAAGYAIWEISGGELKGTEALSIKSGKFLITGGSFIADGDYVNPATAWGDGTEATGAALSITTNDGYAKNVVVEISGNPTFSSANQAAFYESDTQTHSGTALESLTINGGEFTTTNTNGMSAIYLKNSAAIPTISIKDAEEKVNLLYPGVDLKINGESLAVWGKDDSGYQLTIKKAGNYMLMDDFTTSGNGVRIQADNVVFDGNGKKITSTGAASADYEQESIMFVEGSNVDVANLTIDDSSRNAVDGKATSAVTLGWNRHTLTEKNYQEISLYNVDIKAGSSNYKSTGIVVGAKNVSIIESDITLGTSSPENVGIRFYNDDNFKIEAGSVSTIIGNTITGTTNAVGILFDDVQDPAVDFTAGIYGNTFNLGANGVVLKAKPASGENKAALDVQFISNKVTAKTFLSALAGGEGYIFNLTGIAINNDFTGFDKTAFATIENGVTYNDQVVWWEEPEKISDVLAGIEEDDPFMKLMFEKWFAVKLYDEQEYFAGNWWGAWSEGYMEPTGVKTLTEEDANLPVADLRPLVLVGEAETVTIEVTGDVGISTTATSGKLTAALSNGADTTFTWSIKENTDSVISDPLTQNGAEVTYSDTGKVGTATLKVEATLNGKTITEEVLVTVYEDAIPTAPANGAVGEETTSTGTTETTIKADEMTVSSTDKSVTIKEGTVAVTIGFENTPVLNTAGAYQGVVTSVKATYPELMAPVTPNSTVPVNVSLVIALDPTKALVSGEAGVALPSISPAIVDTVVSEITNTNYQVLAMFTADTSSLTEFGKNISTNGVTVNFIIKGDTTGLKFKIIHIGQGEEITPTTSKDAEGNTVVTGISNYGFSSYVLVQDNTKTETTTGGSGSPSSGSSTWLPSDPAQQPTETPTEQPTDKPTDTVPTDIPSTQPTATPSTPGFGILAVIAGLGAVAVLRRQ